MSSTEIDLVRGNPTKKPATLVQLRNGVDLDAAELRLSTTSLSDSIETLRLRPTRATTPALVELLDLMSSPILLIESSPTGSRERWRPHALRRRRRDCGSD